jgi:MFS family permease
LLEAGPVFSQFPKIAACGDFLRGRSPRRILSASILNGQGRRLKDANLGGDNMASGTMALEGTPAEYGIWRVIMASAVGTMIEWYDFYIFGSLAAILSPKFYPPGNETFAYIAYLATFAVGFLVRPFGALFFGRIGDMVGRKYAFIVTLSIMGGATALIGLLPTYQTAGWFSPITLLAIRVLQGLALGGEYGGAAVYVAEHVPDGKRGFYTSFIQITATLGLFVSLLVVLGTQNAMTKEQFADWGWRIPFLLSIVLVTISLYIRLKMKESPIFSQLKTSGMTSSKPLTEAFTKWENLKRVLISLFGATAGQGVVWYTGQFYALFYLQTVLKVNPKTSNIIVAIALLLAMPFFTVFGALSDRIGRKWLMMAACLLAILTYVPIYKSMEAAAGNNINGLKSAKNKVTGAISLTALTTDPATGQQVAAKEAPNPDVPKLVLLVFIQVIYVCMIYGPIAAYLVEAFPAKIRYTALSLPYHIGNGVFGGLLPLIGLSLCARTGNIYAGLYYPMGVAAVTLVLGSLFLKETHGTLIWAEYDQATKKA